MKSLPPMLLQLQYSYKNKFSKLAAFHDVSLVESLHMWNDYLMIFSQHK